MNSTSKKILISFSGLLTILILLEIILRIIGYTQFKKVSVDIIPRNRIIISCFGDSFTRGLGASNGKDYPSQLQTILDKENLNKFKIINFGEQGTNSTHALNNFKSNFYKIKPDCIIIMTGLNNVINQWGYKKNNNSKLNYLNDILWRIRIYKLINILIENFKNRLTNINPNEDKMLESDLYKKNLIEFKNYEKKDFKNSLRFFKLGMFYFKESNREAYNLFKKGILHDPDEGLNYWGLGLAYETLGNYEDGIKWLLKGTKAKKNNDQCLLEIGRMYERHALLDDAVKYYIEGRKKFPSCLDFYKKLSEFSKNQKYKKEIENNIKNIPIQLNAYYAKEFNNIYYKNELNNDGILKWLYSDLYNIYKICRENNVKLILMSYPINKHYISNRTINPALKNFAIKNNISFIDNNSIFSSIDNRCDSLYAFDDFHCNAKGYNLIARNIFNKMKEENLFGLGRK